MNGLVFLSDKIQSIGGKIENFIFYKNEHLTILTKSMLEEIIKDIDFLNIKYKYHLKNYHFQKSLVSFSPKKMRMTL